MDKERYIWLHGDKVPVSEEVYRVYYRAEWRENKQKAVHREKECSLDFMIEHDFDRQADPDQSSIDDIVADKLMLEQLIDAVSELNKEERYLIESLFYQNRTENYVANASGVSQQAISKQKGKIIKKLRKLLNL